MRSRLVCLFVLLSCALGTAAVPAAETVTLCFEKRDIPPWRMVNGEGLNFALLKMAAQRLDLHFDFQGLPWKRCLAKLQSNEVQGAFAISFTADRLAYAAYPGGAAPDPAKRMQMSTYVLLHKKGAQISWDGKRFAHVTGPIGYQLGYSIGAMLTSLDVPRQELNHTPAGLARLVQNGQLSAAAIFSNEAETLLAMPLGAGLETSPLPIADKAYYLVFSRAMAASDPKLAERIWNAVQEARDSPEYARLKHEAGIVD